MDANEMTKEEALINAGFRKRYGFPIFAKMKYELNLVKII